MKGENYRAVYEVLQIFIGRQNSVNSTVYVQGGPERSRQSNLAVFTVEGGLDSNKRYHYIVIGNRC